MVSLRWNKYIPILGDEAWEAWRLTAFQFFFFLQWELKYNTQKGTYVLWQSSTNSFLASNTSSLAVVTVPSNVNANGNWIDNVPAQWVILQDLHDYTVT